MVKSLKIPRRRRLPPAAPPSHLDHLRYAIRPDRLRAGNGITLHCGGGDAYAAMLAAIAHAERAVCLEMYIIRADVAGRRFSAALRDRARVGVSVRLIYDAIGCLGLPRDYVRELEQDGVQVIEYHPIQPWKKRFGLNRRDHRKLLVVDDRVAFLGGMNIGDEYLPKSEGGQGWHDTLCEVHGPVVLDLARLFRKVWVREGGAFYAIAARQAEAPAGGCLARAVDNGKMRQRRKIRRAYLHAINKAVACVHIMSAYFLPDSGIRRALRRAAGRGVAVRIIVPEDSDVAILKYAGEYVYGPLMRAGIEILSWPDTMMHAKSAVIDSAWASVGSYNLDSRSLFYNLEIMLEIVDRDFGALLNTQFEADAALCQRLTLAAWERRPRWKKLLSWFLYQFRRWL